ncbi:hypothetical protein [Pseudorhodoferax sp.]|uniref:hypothetical protein n=1 Tax=Pseudorhodoferax sp. TaxID=1993553 RepID=UPI0039E4699C
MHRLQNKVAIVTGAGSGTGIGAVVARVFAEEGAKAALLPAGDEAPSITGADLVVDGEPPPL